jgi:hypothetical protein
MWAEVKELQKDWLKLWEDYLEIVMASWNAMLKGAMTLKAPKMAQMTLMGSRKA